MPHDIVQCLEKSAALDLRIERYEAHKAYLSTAAVNITMFGPLTSEDGERMIGSFFLIEANAIEDVEAFNKADPFFSAGLWKTIQIHRFHKRVDNR